MTLTILASVSLLALVSSARPLPRTDESWKGLQLPGTGEEGAHVQQVIQTVVKSHASLPEDLKDEDNVNVRLASIEEVQAYLSSTESGTIKALIPLDQDELHSPDEKELHELLNRLEEDRANRSPVPDEVLDSLNLAASPSSDSQASGLASTVSDSENGLNGPTEFSASKPVVVLAVSCAIALLAVCCIAAALYLIETLRKSVFRSTWGILPHLEKNVLPEMGRKGGVSFEACEVIEGGTDKMPGALCIINYNANTGTLHLPHLPRMGSRASLCEAGPDASDSGDEIDEKFFDADSSEVDDGPDPRSASVNPPPSLPALASAVATATGVAIAHAPDMCEVTKSDSESQTSITHTTPRPSWSVRAQEAGALIHAHDNYDRSQQERRHGTFTAPHLDAALAMQLRPGLGIGADAAWLVRFVMALFGWCAVLMSGGGWRR